ncbi:bumetanide-sensitive sodium-(potassium)-chloride cotransporter isoform X1 [Folsomia candida]|uniref:bumetanide-sensitive sodium-(potassium)-chloride cotransporter isoform X1 n=1 Tax=Folsomia candida TaxID=158441 RepID=UPI000B8FC41F|nr:bumetanide-sensitive sodium-(potassium)-chloride cotransporter isoform X1 [Folsomia candida]
MDIDLRDKRNRFQVNRVDSTVNSNGHSPVPSRVGGAAGEATLVGYTPAVDADGNGRLSPSDGSCASPAMLISPTHHRHSVADQAHFTLSGNYDTKYAKSFRHFTREALPSLDNYRNMMSIQAAYRPTLDELHDLTLHGKDQPQEGATKGDAPESAVKFGWVKGVFVRCLLNIWGVMLFLRLSWVTGQAGIGQTFLIITSTSLITFITALSLSSISTNGEVKAGGTYYMISRSLGPEFGASIGFIFAVANAVAAAMYVVGFAESMVDLLKSLGTYVVLDDTNSVRIIGSVAIVVLTCVVVVGMEWEATAQVGLLIILLAAMVDFVIGSFIGPISDEEFSKGFVGYNGSLFLENLAPDYRLTKEGQQTFFSVFSIFFPAATGILAGANISGDLADPQYSIPLGTLLAILVTTISYLAFALISGACVLREATGNFTVPEYLVNGSREDRWSYISSGFNLCQTNKFNGTIYVGNATDAECQWGLLNSFQVMELVSISGGLIYAGCFAATLSSALASLVSAPKVFQALCNDKLYPYLEFFGKGQGKSNEPIRGYVLTFVVALAFILIAQLNVIAPLISNFFLAAYALVNFSTFHASLIKPVGWRPTFKYYNLWLSLVGGLLCVAVMFLISWQTAILTIGAVAFLYLIVVYRKPEVNWGSSTQAQTYKTALSSVHQLNNVQEHVKNYRPQILVLSGHPSFRPSLVDFGYLITKQISLLVCGQIVKRPLNNRQRKALIDKAQDWFTSNKLKGFFNLVDDMSFQEGSKALLQASGVGKLRPNVLLMGFKNNWNTCNFEELNEYFGTIHKAMDMHLAVTILRVGNGMDFSKSVIFGEDIPASTLQPDNKSESLDECLPRNQSLSQMSHASSGELGSCEATRTLAKTENKDAKLSPKNVYRSVHGGEIPRDIMESITRFQKKRKDGVIDVWWLYDDGGLTLLLPYIINTRPNFASCKLRVFALANKKDEFDAEQRSMAGLLAKFRIDYSDLKIVTDYAKKPHDTTRALFESIIAPYRRKEKLPGEDDGCIITDTDLITSKDKCNRYMRLRDLLQETSRCSDLVVMTLPMPRKGVIPAPLFMSWIDILTRDMPPFLLVRGNQTSVLTFYS